MGPLLVMCLCAVSLWIGTVWAQVAKIDEKPVADLQSALIYARGTSSSPDEMVRRFFKSGTDFPPP